MIFNAIETRQKYIINISDCFMMLLLQKTKVNSYKFENLLSLTKYRVAVAAVNANGMSLPSPYIILTTPVDCKYKNKL